MDPERRRLILSFSEFEEIDNNPSAHEESIFGSKTVYQYVIDEIDPALKRFCCSYCYQWGWMPSFYNPIYLICFVGFFIKTYVGASFHWCLGSYIPIKANEGEEDEFLRKHVIYYSLGVALFNILFSAFLPIVSPDEFGLKNELSIVASICVIVTSLIFLKAFNDELYLSIRLANFTTWVVTFFLILLSAYSTQLFETPLWLSLGALVISYIETIIFLFIAVSSCRFWSQFEYIKTRQWKDFQLLFLLVLVHLVIVTSLYYLIEAMIANPVVNVNVAP
jgi:hypothetical protein